MQIKTTRSYLLTPVRMLTTKRQINVGEDMEKREHLYVVGGYVRWYSHCGNRIRGSSNN